MSSAVVRSGDSDSISRQEEISYSLPLTTRFLLPSNRSNRRFEQGSHNCEVRWGLEGFDFHNSIVILVLLQLASSSKEWAHCTGNGGWPHYVAK